MGHHGSSPGVIIVTSLRFIYPVSTLNLSKIPLVGSAGRLRLTSVCLSSKNEVKRTLHFGLDQIGFAATLSSVNLLTLDILKDYGLGHTTHMPRCDNFIGE